MCVCVCVCVSSTVSVYVGVGSYVWWSYDQVCPTINTPGVDGPSLLVISRQILSIVIVSLIGFSARVILTMWSIAYVCDDDDRHVFNCFTLFFHLFAFVFYALYIAAFLVS